MPFLEIAQAADYTCEKSYYIVWERKSAKKQSCSRPLRRSKVAASKAIIPAYLTYLDEFGISIATNSLAIIAEVVESAPTARLGDEPKIVKSTIGSKTVYITVTKGMPTIWVYFRTSGMANDVGVIPAVISKGDLCRVERQNSLEKG